MSSSGHGGGSKNKSVTGNRRLLQAAANQADIQALKRELELGIATPMMEDSSGWTAMHWVMLPSVAIGRGADSDDRVECFKLLMQHGGSLDITWPKPQNLQPVHAMAARNLAKLLRYVHETYHLDLDATFNPKVKITALHVCFPNTGVCWSWDINYKMIETLVELGADIYREENYEHTNAMHMAIDADDTKALGIFMKTPNFDMERLYFKDGWTLLMYAIWRRNMKTAELLVKAGANLETKTPDGFNAYKVAIGNIPKSETKLWKEINRVLQVETQEMKAQKLAKERADARWKRLYRPADVKKLVKYTSCQLIAQQESRALFLKHFKPESLEQALEGEDAGQPKLMEDLNADDDDDSKWAAGGAAMMDMGSDAASSRLDWETELEKQNESIAERRRNASRRPSRRAATEAAAAVLAASVPQRPKAKPRPRKKLDKAPFLRVLAEGGVDSRLEVREILDMSNPVKKMQPDKAVHGLFTQRYLDSAIPKGTVLGEYTGEVVSYGSCWEKTHTVCLNGVGLTKCDHEYSLELCESQRWAGGEENKVLCIESRIYGNETRMANDYRNKFGSDRIMNARLTEEIIDGWPRVFLVATQHIPQDTEVLVSYGHKYWSVMETNVKEFDEVVAITNELCLAMVESISDKLEEELEVNPNKPADELLAPVRAYVDSLIQQTKERIKLLPADIQPKKCLAVKTALAMEDGNGIDPESQLDEVELIEAEILEAERAKKQAQARAEALAKGKAKGKATRRKSGPRW